MDRSGGSKVWTANFDTLIEAISHKIASLVILVQQWSERMYIV